MSLFQLNPFYKCGVFGDVGESEVSACTNVVFVEIPMRRLMAVFVRRLDTRDVLCAHSIKEFGKHRVDGRLSRPR